MQVTLHSKMMSHHRMAHPWVFRGGLQKVSAEQAGVVEVLSPQGKMLGQALYSPRSQIALRWLTRGKEKWDKDLLHSRLEKASQQRQNFFPKEKCYRLVFGEADGLPSLIVDRFEEIFVLQTLSAGMETLKKEVVLWLQNKFQPRSIVERNDSAVRQKEGLSQIKQIIWGEDIQEFQATILGKSFMIRPLEGQKTGFFLDQRFHATQVAPLLKGNILDAFSYSGQFAIHGAEYAKQILCLDQSSEALQQVKANAKLNDCADKISTQESNVFDFLKELDRSTSSRKGVYDTILLDPPAFVKSRSAIQAALRGYKEINLRAMKLIKPGGYLITSSCSQNLSRIDFINILKESAQDAHRCCKILVELTQPADHPRLLEMPESDYLKGFVLLVN